MANDQIPSLWPALIKPGILSPHQILQAQAAALVEQTAGILSGVLAMKAYQTGDTRFSLITFDLHSAALKYSYRLLSVLHQQDLPYPLIVDADIFRPGCNETQDNVLKGTANLKSYVVPRGEGSVSLKGVVPYIAASEDNFKDVLTKV